LSFARRSISLSAAECFSVRFNSRGPFFMKAPGTALDHPLLNAPVLDLRHPLHPSQWHSGTCRSTTHCGAARFFKQEAAAQLDRMRQAPVYEASFISVTTKPSKTAPTNPLMISPETYWATDLGSASRHRNTPQVLSRAVLATPQLQAVNPISRTRFLKRASATIGLIQGLLSGL